MRDAQNKEVGWGSDLELVLWRCGVDEWKSQKVAVCLLDIKCTSDKWYIITMTYNIRAPVGANDIPVWKGKNIDHNKLQDTHSHAFPVIRVDLLALYD